MIDLLRHGLAYYQGLGWPIAVAVTLGVPVLSLSVALLLMLRLPADYFVRAADRSGFLPSHRVVRHLLLVVKNLLGLLALLVGVVMALPLVPGPGILFILVGLGLLDLPGKRALQRRLLRGPRVLASVNRMRAHFGKPALRTEEHGSGSMVDSGS